jgi:hypothetical protein
VRTALRVASWVVLAAAVAAAGLVVLADQPRPRAALTLVSLGLIVCCLGLRALAGRGPGHPADPSGDP